MDLAKAKQLLEMLRRRTEDRGATAAEAAQAAELAEKIIERYGLDRGESSDVEEVYEMCEKRFPRWAHILCWAIEERFAVKGRYTWRVGDRCSIVFCGPEHLARVSCWLFAAIVQDLDVRSRREAELHGVVGGELRKFRNAFRRAACWEVWLRMQRPTPHIASQSIASAQHSPKQRPRKRAARAMTDAEWHAYVAGARFGREVSIDTNAVGTAHGRPVAAIEARPRAKRQVTLF